MTSKTGQQLDLDDILRILHAAVRRSCPDWLHSEADDLVQEAAIKIMDRINQGEGSDSLSSSYLWRVGYSVVIDEIRRRRRKRETSMDETQHDTTPATNPGPEQLAASRDLAGGVTSCLQQMSEERRRAVTLRLVGHSVRELSELLGWSYKRAENYVYRGLDDLRKCLSDKGLSP